MITIKEVSKISGYSISTVSRALNDMPEVSKETSDKIKSVAKSIGFVPNSNAKQLKQTSSNCIGIVVKGKNHALFSSIIELMQTTIKNTEYTNTVMYLDENDDEVEYAIKLTRERKPIGLVFLGGNCVNFYKNFSQITIPSILVTASGENLNFSNLSSITTNDQEAAAYAVEYLIKAGHKKIGILGGSLQTSDASKLRYKGCMDTFLKNHIFYDQNLMYEQARFSFESSYKAMDRLLKKCPDISAVFAMSDIMAIGAIRYIHDNGYKVPQDISVVGFDGIELTQYYSPKITTVKQSQELLAKRSLEILINNIEQDTTPIHEMVPFSILEGESVSFLNK